jgi:uncharacterized Tic20 family protein
MCVPDPVPANDFILNLVGELGPVEFWFIFVVFNFGLIYFLLRLNPKKENRKTLVQRFWKDRPYQGIWLVLIPLAFVLILPEAYAHFRNCLAALKPVVEPQSVYESACQTHALFRDSTLVSIGAAIVGFIVAFVVWPAVFRRSTVSDPEYWFFTKGRFTPAGWFFLIMCGIVVTSIILFVVHSINDFLFLFRIVSEVKSLKLSPTPADSLDGLRPVQSYLIGFMILWSVGMFLAWFLSKRRRKYGKVKPGRRDYLAWLNFAVCVVVIAAVGYLLYRTGLLLASQQEALFEAVSVGLVTAETAALYPRYPVDWYIIIGLVPNLASLVGTFNAVRREMSTALAPQADTE